MIAPRTFDDILSPYPSEVQSLARSARALIAKVLPDAEEAIDGSAPVIGYGYGTGYKGMICTLLLSKTGVKIGLANGREPPGPGSSPGGIRQDPQVRSVVHGERS